MANKVEDFIQQGDHADRPSDNSAGTIGRLYSEDDTGEVYRDNGATWDLWAVRIAGGAGSDTTAVHSGDAADGDLSGTYPNPGVAKVGGVAVTVDTDGTLAANSDAKLATQKAVKTYADAHSGGAGTDTSAVHTNVANEISGVTEKTSLANDDLFLIEDSAASGVKKKVKKSNLGAGGSGAAITEGAYGSIPGSPTDNDLYLATDGNLLNHRASSAWVPWGPLNKLTLPLAVTGQDTTLNNGGTMNSGDTSCTITSATGFPSAPFFIVIDSETIRVGARSGTSLTSLTRGYNGTSAASHSDGATVTLKNWIWANQGTSAVDQTLGPTIMTSQVAGGQTLRALYRNAPSTPYTITALVAKEVTEHINYLGCGIGFRENSSGKFLMLGPEEADGTYYFGLMRWASTTSLTTSYKSTPTMGVKPFYWLRIKDDGTNLIFYVSASGLEGTFIQYDSRARNNYFSTGPDGIAMCLYQENGSVQSVGSFWSWEQT